MNLIQGSKELLKLAGGLPELILCIILPISRQGRIQGGDWGDRSPWNLRK